MGQAKFSAYFGIGCCVALAGIVLFHHFYQKDKTEEQSTLNYILLILQAIAAVLLGLTYYFSGRNGPLENRKMLWVWGLFVVVSCSIAAYRFKENTKTLVGYLTFQGVFALMALITLFYGTSDRDAIHHYRITQLSKDLKDAENFRDGIVKDGAKLAKSGYSDDAEAVSQQLAAADAHVEKLTEQLNQAKQRRWEPSASKAAKPSRARAAELKQQAEGKDAYIDRLLNEENIKHAHEDVDLAQKKYDNARKLDEKARAGLSQSKKSQAAKQLKKSTADLQQKTQVLDNLTDNVGKDYEMLDLPKVQNIGKDNKMVDVPKVAKIDIKRQIEAASKDLEEKTQLVERENQKLQKLLDGQMKASSNESRNNIAKLVDEQKQAFEQALRQQGESTAKLNKVGAQQDGWEYM